MFCVKLHSGRYGKKNTRCFRLAKRSVSFPLNSHEFGVIKSEWKCFPDQQNSGLSISCHKENQGLWPREWTIFVNLVKMLNQRLTYHFLCFWVIYSSFEEQNIWYNFKKQTYVSPSMLISCCTTFFAERRAWLLRTAKNGEKMSKFRIRWPYFWPFLVI